MIRIGLQVFRGFTKFIEKSKPDILRQGAQRTLMLPVKPVLLQDGEGNQEIHVS